MNAMSKELLITIISPRLITIVATLLLPRLGLGLLLFFSFEFGLCRLAQLGLLLRRRLLGVGVVEVVRRVVVGVLGPQFSAQRQ